MMMAYKGTTLKYTTHIINVLVVIYCILKPGKIAYLIVFLRPIVKMNVKKIGVWINAFNHGHAPVEVIFHIEVKSLSEVFLNLIILRLFNVFFNVFVNFRWLGFRAIGKARVSQ